MTSPTTQADRIDRVRRAPTIIGKVWLIVLMADAPIGMRDVHNALCTVMDDPTEPNVLSSRLAEAVARGYLMQSGQRQSMRYRVTHNCTIPPGIRVRDVLDLAQA